MSVWLTALALYLSPTVIILAVVAVIVIADRLRRRRQP